jgi:hypothetical protein
MGDDIFLTFTWKKNNLLYCIDYILVLVLMSCKGSRASGQLTSNILYITTSANTNPCVTKVCAVKGSQAFPFYSIFDAQDFYYSQPNSRTPENIVTYLFVDNGTHVLDRRLTLSVFENIEAATAKGAILQGNVQYVALHDGTNPGVVGMTFFGINFSQPDPNNTTPLLAFVLENPNLQLYANFNTVNLKGCMQGMGDHGLFHLTARNGAQLYVNTNGCVVLAMPGTEGHLVTISGDDEEAMGSLVSFSPLYTYITHMGDKGSAVMVQSALANENHLVTIDFTAPVKCSSSDPAVSLMNGFAGMPTQGNTTDHSVDPLTSPNIVATLKGNITAIGTGGAISSTAQGIAYTLAQLADSSVSAVTPTVPVASVLTMGQASHDFHSTGVTLTALGGGTTYQNIHQSTGNYNGDWKDTFFSQGKLSTIPVLLTEATLGTYSTNCTNAKISANTIEGVPAVLKDIKGTANYSSTFSSGKAVQAGDGDLYHWYLSEDANAITIDNSNEFTVGSGAVSKTTINTTGEHVKRKQGNTTRQTKASTKSATEYTLINGTSNRTGDGNSFFAQTTAPAYIFTQASGTLATNTSRNKEVTNSGGGGAIVKTFTGSSTYKDTSFGATTVGSIVYDASQLDPVNGSANINLNSGTTTTAPAEMIAAVTVSGPSLPLINSSIHVLETVASAPVTFTAANTQNEGGLSMDGSLIASVANSSLTSSNCPALVASGATVTTTGCSILSTYTNPPGAGQPNGTVTMKGGAQINAQTTTVTHRSGGLKDTGAAVQAMEGSIFALASSSVTSAASDAPAIMIGAKGTLSGSLVLGANMPGQAFIMLDHPSAKATINTTRVSPNGDAQQMIVDGVLGSILAQGSNVTNAANQMIGKNVLVNTLPNTYSQ